MPIEKEFYKVSELSVILGFSKETIKRKLRTGELKGFKGKGKNGAWRIHKSEIEQHKRIKRGE